MDIQRVSQIVNRVYGSSASVMRRCRGHDRYCYPDSAPWAFTPSFTWWRRRFLACVETMRVVGSRNFLIPSWGSPRRSRDNLRCRAFRSTSWSSGVHVPGLILHCCPDTSHRYGAECSEALEGTVSRTHQNLINDTDDRPRPSSSPMRSHHAHRTRYFRLSAQWTRPWTESWSPKVRCSAPVQDPTHGQGLGAAGPWLRGGMGCG